MTVRMGERYVDGAGSLTQAGYSALRGIETAQEAADTALDTRVDALEAVAITEADGSAPRFACRAWVNFNGTGTVAIRDSGNVASITDNGVGDYTINFTTAMPDVNYAVVVGVANTSSDNWTCSPISRAVGSVQVRVANGSNVNSDASFISVVIFR